MKIVSPQIKFYTLIVTVFLFGNKSFGQQAQLTAQGIHFGLGFEAGIPTGQLNDFYNFSVGGTARIQYNFNAPLAFILTSGYTSFIGKQVINGATVSYSTNSYNRYASYNIVPLKAGFKAFAATNFYVSAEGGAGFETNNGGSTKLILSPGFGYTSAGARLDLGLRYDNISGQRVRTGQFVARVAYDF